MCVRYLQIGGDDGAQESANGFFSLALKPLHLAQQQALGEAIAQSREERHLLLLLVVGLRLHITTHKSRIVKNYLDEFQ